MVYRIFVEKKPGLAHEAQTLLSEARTLLNIQNLEQVRIINRYDAENISRELFDNAIKTVFSEPQLDNAFGTPDTAEGHFFAVEYLPGQYDQRADSAAQCIQIIGQGERPLIRTAKIFGLIGNLSQSDINKIKKYVINPVEAREASFALPDTLKTEYPVPEKIAVIEDFIQKDDAQLSQMVSAYGFAMDLDDLKFCQEYFRSENRNPTMTELRVIDTYWSDHCRHTTFLTVIDNVTFEDALLQKTYEQYLQMRKDLNIKKPVCLMDIATISAKHLKRQGKLPNLDESEEINACTVKIQVEANGVREPWLLLFKNETHNHPTEIEPFGGAATCIGGAIRDPLSGRSYVYGAMRVTGAADPLQSVEDTPAGKLPQRKIVTGAANGYSSYGNQIGLATGIVDEIYHPGYAAKRMEIGAVVGAAPAENVRREVPSDGDVVILLGGSTGRDGCGGATGSSKSHTAASLESCGAEVQKGNAPEERKLQRLFRKKEVCHLIKRCNDFGAGGVSVAVGELADGLTINLDAVPKKYDGLDGTELAISESQERMAVVVEERDAPVFLRLAQQENLQACIIAKVTKEPRLVMHWNGDKIVDLSRGFLNSNGAEKHISIKTAPPHFVSKAVCDSFSEAMKSIASDLNTCSRRGLSEQFDSTIGAGTVLMPFGGTYQRTPIQAMVHKISMEQAHISDCSLMSYGYNPFLSEQSPYHGAYHAVVESVSKLIATGAEFFHVYLTFQEYFARPGKDSARWGAPLAALLGAFQAQIDLEIAAIGGKDSMSGTFEDLDVPPTLVSFAVTTEKEQHIVSPEWKTAGNHVILLRPRYNENGLPNTASLKETFGQVTKLLREGKAVSCYTLGMGGIGEAVMKCAMGNGFGFDFAPEMKSEELFRPCYGSFLLEVPLSVTVGKRIGVIREQPVFTLGNQHISLKECADLYETKTESVYRCNIAPAKTPVKNFTFACQTKKSAAVSCAKPKVLIPVFPGTNCEYDSAKAIADAGGEPVIFVVQNLTSEQTKRSVDGFAQLVKEAQMIFLPGGFSGADEPDGSGKFITAFFRNPAVKEETERLLHHRDGLMCGICNGFQALIKLGLVPYGKIIDTEEHAPTLTYNLIGRHQSKIVRTRVCSNLSPWLSLAKVGEVYNVPISHGEGRFLAEDGLILQLAKNGQIATQYVDFTDNASNEVQFNPNGSCYAVEGITSPDGRVFGKMGHSERIGAGLYKNVPGNYHIRMFESAVQYFRG